jgi:hypothetical protein
MIQHVVIIDTGELWLRKPAFYRQPRGSLYAGKIQ